MDLRCETATAAAPPDLLGSRHPKPSSLTRRGRFACCPARCASSSHTDPLASVVTQAGPGRPSVLRRDQLTDGDVLGPVEDARCARAARRRASPVLDGASVRRRWPGAGSSEATRSPNIKIEIRSTIGLDCLDRFSRATPGHFSQALKGGSPGFPRIP